MGDDGWDKTPSEGGNSDDEPTDGGETDDDVRTFTSSDDIEDELHPVAVVRRMKMYRSTRTNNQNS